MLVRSVIIAAASLTIQASLTAEVSARFALQGLETPQSIVVRTQSANFRSAPVRPMPPPPPVRDGGGIKTPPVRPRFPVIVVTPPFGGAAQPAECSAAWKKMYPARARAVCPPAVSNKPPSGTPPQKQRAPGPRTPPAIVQSTDYVADEVLVTLPASAAAQIENQLERSYNVVVIERVPLPMIDARLVRMRIPDGRRVPRVVAAIGADRRVARAQPNFLYRHNSDESARATPAVAAATLSNLQYALAKLGAAEAHALAQGKGARIAVIDSGVDAEHPDLVGARIEHFDATGTADEIDSHGTGIAGIIAARGSVKGVAPDAELFSARVFHKQGGPARATATTVNILKGLVWSVEKGARVLNMSFAGPRDPLLERHIEVAAERGLVTVAAAGNNGAKAAPVYPAAYEDVIAVTAVDAEDRLYEKANRGDYVDVAAPGVDVIVPVAGRSHQFQSGTSFAAAHVSGIAALLLEIDPKLSPSELREILVTSTDDLGKPGHDSEFGAGRLNAAKAVVKAVITQKNHK